MGDMSELMPKGSIGWAMERMLAGAEVVHPKTGLVWRLTMRRKGDPEPLYLGSLECLQNGVWGVAASSGWKSAGDKP